jgi:hypothetical protein
VTLLVIEDGTGVSGANSWATVAEADSDAASALYPEGWVDTLPVETKEQALILAASMVSTLPTWTYPPLTSTQGLAVPLLNPLDCRGVAVDVPTQLALVKKTQIDLARQVLAGNPFPPPAYGSPTGAGVISSESNSVGSLSSSVTYQAGTATPVQPLPPGSLRYLEQACLVVPLPVNPMGTRSRQVVRTY